LSTVKSLTRPVGKKGSRLLYELLSEKNGKGPYGIKSRKARSNIKIGEPCIRGKEITPATSSQETGTRNYAFNKSAKPDADTDRAHKNFND